METILEVMHVAKRIRSSTGEDGPSIKRAKQVQVDINPQFKKKERKPRRKYITSYLYIGQGQEEYRLLKDVSERTTNITFAYLLGLCPKLKREWKMLANSKKSIE